MGSQLLSSSGILGLRVLSISLTMLDLLVQLVVGFAGPLFHSDFGSGWHSWIDVGCAESQSAVITGLLSAQ